MLLNKQKCLDFRSISRHQSLGKSFTLSTCSNLYFHVLSKSMIPYGIDIYQVILNQSDDFFDFFFFQESGMECLQLMQILLLKRINESQKNKINSKQILIHYYYYYRTWYHTNYFFKNEKRLFLLHVDFAQDIDWLLCICLLFNSWT